MDLWIRSQDGIELKKVDTIIYANCGELNGNKWCIFCNASVMGSFETEKQAKKVVDEIHNILMSDLLCVTNIEFSKEAKECVFPTKVLQITNPRDKASVEFLTRNSCVYQIPKE